MTKLPKYDRRKFISSGVTAGATTLLAPQAFANQGGSTVSINVSTFRTQRWQDFFSSTQGGAILVDLQAFALHFWNSDQSIYRLYPVAIPLKEEFVRRGNTTVTHKIEGPSWTATQNMIKRDPTIPRHIGPGPENPLGTHALYLGWPLYRIHGNNDSRKIGRTSSSGCIGLFNEDIKELFGLVNNGCKVHMI